MVFGVGFFGVWFLVFGLLWVLLLFDFGLWVRGFLRGWYNIPFSDLLGFCLLCLCGLNFVALLEVFGL